MNMKMENKLKLNQEVGFIDNPHKFYVKSKSCRYAVCVTNMKCTNEYTILDFENGIRNKDNFIFDIELEMQKQCDQLLKYVENGEINLEEWQPIPIIFLKKY